MYVHDLWCVISNMTHSVQTDMDPIVTRGKRWQSSTSNSSGTSCCPPTLNLSCGSWRRCPASSSFQSYWSSLLHIPCCYFLTHTVYSTYFGFLHAGLLIWFLHAFLSFCELLGKFLALNFCVSSIFPIMCILDFLWPFDLRCPCLASLSSSSSPPHCPTIVGGWFF